MHIRTCSVCSIVYFLIIICLCLLLMTVKRKWNNNKTQNSVYFTSFFHVLCYYTCLELFSLFCTRNGFKRVLSVDFYLLLDFVSNCWSTSIVVDDCFDFWLFVLCIGVLFELAASTSPILFVLHLLNVSKAL